MIRGQRIGEGESPPGPRFEDRAPALAGERIGESVRGEAGSAGASPSRIRLGRRLALPRLGWLVESGRRGNMRRMANRHKRMAVRAMMVGGLATMMWLGAAGCSSPSGGDSGSKAASSAAAAPTNKRYSGTRYVQNRGKSRVRGSGAMLPAANGAANAGGSQNSLLKLGTKANWGQFKPDAANPPAQVK